jgi:16S rRNA (guanine527-N7)-methyltransferase
VSAGHVPDFDSFAAACRQLQLKITREQFTRLLSYQILLADYNTKINLISRKDTARILTYHIVDSLAPAHLIPLGSTCADIGTGAGLPGIPLAIIRPDLKMYLIESVQKKCRFLEEAKSTLNLTNTETICARSETLPPLNCDILLSRLTADLNRTLRNSAHHLNPNGKLILYKTSNFPLELNKNSRLLKKLNLQPLATYQVKLPFTNIERHFVILARQPSAEN